jgi:endo-1,4-beta-xylanase
MKWPLLAPAVDAYDFSGADALVDFAEANGLRVRGHTLVWSRLNGLPRWLDDVLAASDRPWEALSRLLAAHIDATVRRYAGSIEQWDVVNEPLAFPGHELDPDNIFLAMGGESALVDAFRLAAAADPEARLYLNEIGLEEDAERFEAFVALVERLRAAGAPVHGVGLQGHFFKGPPDAAALKARLDRLATLGFDIEITELDLPIQLFQGAPDPLAAQAEAYAAVVAACLAVKRCHGVTVWGLTDATSWRGPAAQAVLFDDEGQPKPAHSAILATLHQAAQRRIR